jgi:hypothetical protein
MSGLTTPGMNESRSRPTTFPPVFTSLNVTGSFKGSRMVRLGAKIIMKPIQQPLLQEEVERHVSGDRLKCDET